LIRTNTRFWNVGGIGVDFGLVGGLSVKAESLESVITGGIELATPTRAGERVQNGARFKLEDEAGKDWAEWAPDLSG
jgi:paraquat-inducible protein B